MVVIVIISYLPNSASDGQCECVLYICVAVKSRTLHDMPVSGPTFAGTKRCLVTGAHGCEQLAHSCYAFTPEWGSNCIALIAIVLIISFGALNFLQCFDAVGWAAGRASGL